ncbi:hypothetical protein AMAG_04812 [Allomyces macrogynus ATCC 38327]|uniref:F-box domain-containing protein n=1 Tax=Allomyces macrogynus (strain ATCC 38327) TaxID=578462 RepID=A0A0L0S6H0_ALLM3|nr:hypothetical protein AMAG_04812 [Allomyces macrogynus ATCC 38327]|eukprot:KNE57981.1 hypothetical protein AMAG_04812 [Allomyces macrogynus ATCC 38327]
MLTRSATAAARAAARASAPASPLAEPDASSRRGKYKSQPAAPTGDVDRREPDPPVQPTSFAHLPPEILALIFERVGTASIGQLLQCRGVSRQFRGVIEGQALNALYRRVLASWGAPTTINPRARKLKTHYALVYHYFTEHCARCRNHFAAHECEPYAPRIWPFQILCRDCRANRCLRVIRGGDKRTLRRLPTREFLGRHKDKRMCKSTLVKLGLPAKIIAHLPCELVENPHYGGAAPMRLYDPKHVRAVLCAWTGSREPIDPFQSRCGRHGSRDGDGFAHGEGKDDDDSASEFLPEE